MRVERMIWLLREPRHPRQNLAQRCDGPPLIDEFGSCWRKRLF